MSQKVQKGKIEIKYVQSMSYAKIKQLMQENQLDKALLLIDSLDESVDYEKVLLKCEILDLQGDNDKVLEYIDYLNTELQHKQNKTIEFRTRIIQCSMMLKTQNLVDGLSFALTTEKTLEDLSSEEREEIISEESRLYLLLGVFFDYTGDWDTALIYYNKSLEIRRQHGSKQDIAGALNNIGEIYRNKGELDLALDYYQQSHHLYSELANNNLTAITLHNIGIIHNQRGYFDLALQQLKQSLLLFEQAGNLIDVSETLLHLILTSLYLNERDQVDLYFTKMQEIQDREDNQFIKLYTDITQGLILKSENRIKSQADAQRIFEKILTDDTINHEISIFALLNLCELLLYELRTTGEEEILGEISQYVDKLHQIAIDNESSSLQAEVYLIQSRLALIQLNIDQARRLLTQAQLISEVKGLKRLAILISKDHDLLLNSIDRWQDMIDSNSSLSDRLELAEFEDMIVQLIRKKVDTPFLSTEEPILFLILDSSGNTRYKYKFDDEMTIKEGLIGVFISAISNFSMDAFSTTAPIERIKHQDYTIIIRNVKSHLLAYIFKGQSYVALKRMEDLTRDFVNTPDLWVLLEQDKLKMIPESDPILSTILLAHINENV